MKNHYIFFLITIIYINYSCKEDVDIGEDSTAFYNVEYLSSYKNIASKLKVKIDTLRIQGDIETSFVGDFSIFNDTLYFSDNFFGYLFRFNKDGSLIDKHIGRGKGPNEVLGFSDTAISNNNYVFLNDGNGSLCIFNKSFEKEEHHIIDWQVTRSYQDIKKNPIPSLIDSYEFDYAMPNIFKQWDKEHVAIALYATHPKFNGYFDTSLYYNYSRILAIVNIKSGKVVDLVGRRSPLYLSYNNLPNFDHFGFEVAKDNVFINFWADPTIYVLDKEKKVAIGKFGVPGIDMKSNYPTTNGYEEAEELFQQHIQDYGNYRYVKFIPGQNLLLRGYTKGKGSLNDGLQIYKDYSLIGDVEVPKNLEIIGAIGDEFYAVSTFSNEENELVIYKINLFND
ncbi:hypothetical protein ACJOV8_017385 [Formosa sp. 3Alg 14/1]|uniref:hypothetical protein n=1 Tax=Formosa sp. 3Alg 14/1 TaxID=3382190 RepID=UPI0039BE752D